MTSEESCNQIPALPITEEDFEIEYEPVLKKELDFQDINPIWFEILEKNNYHVGYNQCFGTRGKEEIKLSNSSACIVGGVFGFKGGSWEYKLPNGDRCLTCRYFSMSNDNLTFQSFLDASNARTLKQRITEYMQHYNKEHITR